MNRECDCPAAVSSGEKVRRRRQLSQNRNQKSSSFFSGEASRNLPTTKTDTRPSPLESSVTSVRGSETLKRVPANVRDLLSRMREAAVDSSTLLRVILALEKVSRLQKGKVGHNLRVVTLSDLAMQTRLECPGFLPLLEQFAKLVTKPGSDLVILSQARRILELYQLYPARLRHSLKIENRGVGNRQTSQNGWQS